MPFTGPSDPKLPSKDSWMIEENMQWYINQLKLGFPREYRERPERLEDLKRRANAILRRK